jgi:hypothetical protein
VYVWHLQRCIQEGERPTGSKYGAQLALRRIATAHPERSKELKAIPARLNQLYR